MASDLALLSALAVVPEQLAEYVRAAAGSQCLAHDSLILCRQGSFGTLVAYGTAASGKIADLESLGESLGLKHGLEHLTVLAPELPAALPPGASVRKDSYWLLDLPFARAPQKTRNLVGRAAREIRIVREEGGAAWTAEHARLAAELCAARKEAVSAGSRHIFGNLRRYLDAAPQAVLYSAHLENGALAACAIADFTALETAFYMFAFRSRKAPPGSADALLNEIIREAGERGHARVNLGLGLNPGVEFFKKKWGAKPALPYFEIAWKIKRKKGGWLQKLLGKG